jgi:hypothetical protein
VWGNFLVKILFLSCNKKSDIAPPDQRRCGGIAKEISLVETFFFFEEEKENVNSPPLTKDGVGEISRQNFFLYSERPDLVSSCYPLQIETNKL